MEEEEEEVAAATFHEEEEEDAMDVCANRLVNDAILATFDILSKGEEVYIFPVCMYYQHCMEAKLS